MDDRIMKVLESLTSMNDTLKNMEKDYEKLIHKMDAHPVIISDDEEKESENPSNESNLPA
jgi:hypothetical protein